MPTDHYVEQHRHAGRHQRYAREPHTPHYRRQPAATDHVKAVQQRTQQDQPRPYGEIVPNRKVRTTEGQPDPRVADHGSHPLHRLDRRTESQPLDQQHHRRVAEQDQPLDAGAQELEPQKVGITGQIVSHHPEDDHDRYLPARKRPLFPLTPALPVTDTQKKREGEGHAQPEQHDTRHVIILVSQLDDDGLGGEKNGPQQG